MSKIITFLAYDHQAEEAARFYVSIFKNSRIRKVSYYGDTGPGPKGSVMAVSFELDGQEYAAMNGGPHFKLTEAASLMVLCDTQEEVDTYWEKLSSGGGKTNVCGWLTDKFGLSWQVTPKLLMELVADSDPARAQRVMQAMMKMTKIEIAGLKRAAEGE